MDGKTILRIGQFESSSKLCNVCGNHNSDLTLKDREWVCPDCKTPHDREINAAINIKKFSLLDQNLITLNTCGTQGRAWGLALRRERDELGSPLNL